MRGRIPRDEELSDAEGFRAALGSVPRAFSILRRTTGAEKWKSIAEQRASDLLVYLALARFGGRPSFRRLPLELRYDVRDLFGSFKLAAQRADDLLYRVGDRALLDSAMRASSIGKLTPEALYVHVSAVGQLDPILRAYEGCGRALTGNVDGATVLKLHRLSRRSRTLSILRSTATHTRRSQLFS
jgi:DNA phosphorothioation-associated putative methyltransferase